MITLHETQSRIKTGEPWHELGPEGVADDPTADVGTIVIKIGLGGISSVQILAEDSAREEILCRRLAAARPALQLLQTCVTVEE